MSLFESESKVMYELQTYNKDDNDIHLDNLQNEALCFRAKLSIYERLIMILCCIPRLPSNHIQDKRFNCTKCFIVSLNAIFIITLLSISILLAIFMLSPQTLDTDTDFGPDIYQIISIFFLSSIVILRILVIIYFYYYFDYPWKDRLDFGGYNNNNYNLPKYSRKFSFLYKFIIISCILMEIGSAIALSSPYDAFTVTAVFCLYLFILIPNFTPIIIQCAICDKYENYLIQLKSSIDSIDIDYYDLFMFYKKIYYEFNKDFKSILQICVHLNLMSVLAFIWITIYDALSSGYGIIEILWIALHSMSILICYIYSGCFLNETFESLIKSLWKQTEQDMSEKKEFHQEQSMFIIYLINHPLQIKFSGIRITRKNTMIFAFTFVATKIVSLFVAYLYFY